MARSFADVVAEPDESLILIVQWSLFSTRKLTTRELYFAVQASVDRTGTGCWDVDEIDDDGMVIYLVHASRGLMETSYSITKTHSLTTGPGSNREQTLIFIHESVREYFLCGGLASITKPSPHETNAVGHAKLAGACLSYLESAVSHSSIPVFCKIGDWTVITERGKERLPFIGYASDHFLYHAEMAFASDVVDLAILEKLPLECTTTWLSSDLGFHPRLGQGNTPSLLYLLLHRSCFKLARALVTQPSNPLRCPTARYDDTSTPRTSTCLVRPDLRVAYDELSLAIRLGRMDLVQLLFDNGFDVNMEAGPWGRPISFAVSRDQYEVVQTLWNHGARVDTVETKNILHIAAKLANEVIVQFLLKKGVDVNGTDDRSQTALHLNVERQSYLAMYDITPMFVSPLRESFSKLEPT